MILCTAFIFSIQYGIDKKIIVTSKDINYSEYSKTHRIVIQNDQLGTGNAVIETKNELKNFKGVIVICFADTPFITKKTIKKLINSIKQADTSLLMPFFYTTLIFVIFLDLVVFNSVPDKISYGGATIIILGSFIVTLREYKIKNIRVGAD